jgi:NurA-like 5'-3' nuclease
MIKLKNILYEQHHVDALDKIKQLLEAMEDHLESMFADYELMGQHSKDKTMIEIAKGCIRFLFRETIAGVIATIKTIENGTTNNVKESVSGACNLLAEIVVFVENEEAWLNTLPNSAIKSKLLRKLKELEAYQNEIIELFGS